MIDINRGEAKTEKEKIKPDWELVGRWSQRAAALSMALEEYDILHPEADNAT
jgi:hypothetical protein